MSNNGELVSLVDEFLRHYYKHRGIEDLASEALETVRKRTEIAKEKYKSKRDTIRKPQARVLSSRILKNRRATAAAKVRDEVYKRKLIADVRKFEMKCASLRWELESKQLQLYQTRQRNHELKTRLELNNIAKKKNITIVQSSGLTYEERRRAGFICPSLFGNATDLFRYGGTLPLFNQD